MRATGQNPTEAEIQTIINSVDQDKNGTVSFDEFCVMMKAKQANSDPEQEILQAFKVFDKDGSGTISADELIQVLTNLGEVVTKQQVLDMIADVDTDGDGNLDYKELVKLMLG